MIARYSRPEMARVWSDQSRFGAWLEVELAATEVLAERGIVPPEALQAIREKARFDPARIDEIEREVKHDVIAFVSNVAENVGPQGRWLHYGLTSSDVVDTALSLLIRRASDIVLEGVRELMEAVRARAEEHRRTPMMGRTHGMHAEPTTFGLKLALWYAELQRDLDRLERARAVISVGKLSGAVGTYSHLPPDVEEAVCARLELRPAPASSQVLQRDRHAEVMTALAVTAATLEKMGLEIRHLQRTEVGEAEEPFTAGQKGSSAMPHKRNPVGCEQVCGLARVVRANSVAALENVALWHERDISHSSVERVIVPDSFLALDHMLHRMTGIVRGMVVYPERMRRNIDSTRGVVFSGRVLLALTAAGMRREDAYRVVQGHAMAAWEGGADFQARIRQDPEVRAVVGERDLAGLFDLGPYLAHVDTIFARVFGAAAAPRA
jgi:adenylosuccinate lyase